MISKWKLMWWLIKAKFNANRPFYIGIAVAVAVVLGLICYFLIR